VRVWSEQEIVIFLAAGAMNPPWSTRWNFLRVFLWIRISMSGEVSFFSRFLVKFVEIIAAGLASAISAYLLAHFTGFLQSSPPATSTPVPIVVQVGPTTNEVAAQPTPPVAAAGNEQRPAPHHDTDASVAQPAPRTGKDKAPPKHTKTDKSVVEKDPQGQKSAEDIVRAALAHVDANQPVPSHAQTGPGLTDVPSVPIDIQPRQAGVPPRQTNVGPQPMEVPRAAVMQTAPSSTGLPAQPAEPRPTSGTDLPPTSPDIRATVAPLPSSARPSLQVAVPYPPPPVEQDQDEFSALKRLPDLLRPDPPPTGEIPRPPMPVGTVPPQ
jgi:hypothetical protein